jgi:phosphatidylinositol alpha-mannosyltransferase
MPSANEGMCLALLEAMGCGAAVVATHIRTFESLIEEGQSGLLVPVGDVDALAKAIDRAWSARHVLGPEATRRVAAHFDSRRLHQQLARVLRNATRYDGTSALNGVDQKKLALTSST